MAHTVLQSADKVVDALGGPTAVAKITHKSVQAVSNWKRTGRLAPDTFLVLTVELDSRGYRADPSLWGIRAPEASQ